MQGAQNAATAEIAAVASRFNVAIVQLVELQSGLTATLRNFTTPSPHCSVK
jgi:hypothetical protein